VLGPPEQRCWVERVETSRARQVGGGVAGAVVGGILGHQVGSGTGREIATAGGVVAGAAVGSSVARGGGGTDREIQRCDNVTNATPDYWDVTYWFRGVEHHAQLTSPPWQTITVNSDGVPRE
jgi:uncharacterized protein YcfJ